MKPKTAQANYLIAAFLLIACGITGGVLNIWGDGSLLGATAQAIGYFGAGYCYCRWRGTEDAR